VEPGEPLPAGSTPDPNRCAAKDQAAFETKVEAPAGVISRWLSWT
jgi:hypothetical protein